MGRSPGHDVVAQGRQVMETPACLVRAEVDVEVPARIGGIAVEQLAPAGIDEPCRPVMIVQRRPAAGPHEYLCNQKGRERASGPVVTVARDWRSSRSIRHPR